MAMMMGVWLLMALMGPAWSDTPPGECEGEITTCYYQCYRTNETYCIEANATRGCSDPPPCVKSQGSETPIPPLLLVLATLSFCAVGFGGIVKGCVTRARDAKERRAFQLHGATVQGTVIERNEKVEYRDYNHGVEYRHFIEAEYTCNDASRGSPELVTTRKEWLVHRHTFDAHEQGQSITIVVLHGKPLHACLEAELVNAELPGMCSIWTIFYGILVNAGLLVTALIMSGAVVPLTDFDVTWGYILIVIVVVGTGPCAYFYSIKSGAIADEKKWTSGSVKPADTSNVGFVVGVVV